ncbi:MAG: hypothetical protein V9G13_10385 [Marmoricola sp.]
MAVEMTNWNNWCGLTQVTPNEITTPTSASELAEADSTKAASSGRRMKMPGTGHSFTSIAASDDILVRSQGLQGSHRRRSRQPHGHGSGRHPSQRPQQRSGEARLFAAQHG